MQGNLMMLELIKEMAFSFNAVSVSLVENKKYRFQLSDSKVIDIPKKEVEIEFLKLVKLDTMH